MFISHCLAFGSCRFDRVPCVHLLAFVISAGFFAISCWLSSSRQVSLQSPVGFRHLGRFLCNLRLAFVISASFFAISDWLSSSRQVSLQSPVGFRHLGRVLCNLRLAFVVPAGFFAFTNCLSSSWQVSLQSQVNFCHPIMCSGSLYVLWFSVAAHDITRSHRLLNCRLRINRRDAIHRKTPATKKITTFSENSFVDSSTLRR